MINGRHILIVDDCEPLRETLATYLGHEGFRVSTAGDGSAARESIAHDPPDLVIVDLMLPGEDGFSIARYLREHHRCGIIVLTASTDLTNCVVGLEIGADDYISKPHEARELLARVRSVLRRTDVSIHRTPSQPATTNTVRFANWCLDLASHRLTNERLRAVELTTGEFNLLTEFLATPGQVLRREQLLQAVHKRSWDYFDRSIDVLVMRLRQKLEPDGTTRTIIRTVRGAGYLFTASVTYPVH